MVAYLLSNGSILLPITEPREGPAFCNLRVKRGMTREPRRNVFWTPETQIRLHSCGLIIKRCVWGCVGAGELEVQGFQSSRLRRNQGLKASKHEWRLGRCFHVQFRVAGWMGFGCWEKVSLERKRPGLRETMRYPKPHQVSGESRSIEFSPRPVLLPDAGGTCPHESGQNCVWHPSHE